MCLTNIKHYVTHISRFNPLEERRKKASVKINLVNITFDPADCEKKKNLQKTSQAYGAR